MFGQSRSPGSCILPDMIGPLEALRSRRVERPCRICAASHTRLLARGAREYLHCFACGAITLDVTREGYEALNPSYDPGPLSELEDADALRDFLAVDDKRAFLEPYLAGAEGPKRLLDVGCGAGGYLLAARELGCECVGIEPSEEHSTVGRGLGLSIEKGYFADGMFPESSFDLVLLSHVIEHIYEPRPFLESLFKLLRPGGKLIVVTPNAASVVAYLSGRWWVMLKAVDHVSMMTETSFRAMGVGDLGEVSFHQSEYPWEALSSLAAAGRDAVRGVLGELRGRQGAAPISGSVAHPARQSALGWKANMRTIRKALQVAGLPLHQLAVAQGRQACLVMTVTRRAAHV